MKASERRELSNVALAMQGLASEMNDFADAGRLRPAKQVVMTARQHGKTEVLRQAVDYRDADKPAVPPACRNCARYRCDHDDRESFTKGVVIHRTNQRCGLHGFAVTLNKVCDHHAFKHPDRRDA